MPSRTSIKDPPNVVKVFLRVYNYLYILLLIGFSLKQETMFTQEQRKYINDFLTHIEG